MKLFVMRHILGMNSAQYSMLDIQFINIYVFYISHGEQVK